VQRALRALPRFDPRFLGRAAKDRQPSLRAATVASRRSTRLRWPAPPARTRSPVARPTSSQPVSRPPPTRAQRRARGRAAVSGGGLFAARPARDPARGAGPRGGSSKSAAPRVAADAAPETWTETG